MVELAPDQPSGQCNGFKVDSTRTTGWSVNRDAQGATTELQVVEVELEVGNDGLDQGTNTLESAGIAHFRPPFDGELLAFDMLGDPTWALAVKKAWAREPTPLVR